MIVEWADLGVTVGDEVGVAVGDEVGVTQSYLMEKIKLIHIPYNE
jgi:hypothetical protein